MIEPTFDLWLELELEQYKSQPDDGPTDDFANRQLTLPDGRRYALNVGHSPSCSGRVSSGLTKWLVANLPSTSFGPIYSLRDSTA